MDFVPEMMSVLLVCATRKTTSFNGPEMDIIINLLRTYKKIDISSEQHGANAFKRTRSGCITNTPFFMLTTPENRIDDLSSIIKRIMELHMAVFSHRNIRNKFVELMPLVAPQVFKTEKNKAEKNISHEELAFVSTKGANRTFAISPDTVFNIKFDKLLCDFDIKKFVFKDLGMMSFKEVAYVEKQMLYRNFPNQTLPEWRNIHQELY